ncbi:hypothetical protein F5Y00DRAFT_126178 [Daldinia vernicosa]|uniref:uncharacterized protein n=1 Tax=Daldinia vernicosa TaxID=114800 RepID=UPI0020087343|nr:uncharacterized protein F5Y00DRAFT_126178 [Daldinia vernicosa]KAI0847123.1 hypothetical protein F5Y00DRAFT_126178 [Daldinia vernicosa]
MLDFSFLTRGLSPGLRTVFSSPARFKMTPGPKNLMSTIKDKNRFFFAIRRPGSRPTLKMNDISSDVEGTDSECETSNNKYNSGYRNRYGEQTILGLSDPPPGYVFVPAGNQFITWKCRQYPQKRYAVLCRRSRKRPATHTGLYVSRDVFEKVRSEFEAKRASADEKLKRALDKEYPNMPTSDKNQLCDFIFSDPDVIGKSTPKSRRLAIFNYVQANYAPLNSHNLSRENQNTEAIARANQKVQKILTSWRYGERVLCQNEKDNPPKSRAFYELNLKK